MRFRKLNATFGALERRAILFAPGLNIIEAPNEAGKSTLSAFLRTMLYGLPTRDRGALADKNRYLPWSGLPMQGTLELSDENYGDITLQRDTARANSPMGRFSATRAGTGDEVAGLTGADCGEALLGVPREVYERSAFIRQSGLAIDPDAELERRVAALITTGEEGTSYSEASAILRKQLNNRRSNARNGRIPALEREIEADETALSELQSLQAERSSAEAQLAVLRETEAALRRDLATHDVADRQEQYSARKKAKQDAEDAAREARVFRRMLEDSHVPTQDVLEENRGRLRTVEDLAQQQRDAAGMQEAAKAALDEFNAHHKTPYALFAVLCALGALLSVASPVLFTNFTQQSIGTYYWYGLLPAALFAALFAVVWQKRRKTLTQQAALKKGLQEAEAACTALRAQIERTAELVYAAIPAGDAVSANAYVHENLARYDTLKKMEAEAQNKRQYYEEHPQPEIKDIPVKPVQRPERGREALQYELDRAVAQRSEAKSRVDYISGRLRAVGDPGEMEAALAQKREALADLQAEYDAIALAMDTLDHANTVLQSRFSPELGKRAAAYFSALTGGKYEGVVLDRAFHALTTEAGESVERNAALLSQGAGDQLYLAVRLAICDLVLPAEKHIPLVLDDALINFDDKRCAAALELLVKAAETRQILLLTCQHREAAYLAGRDNVTILSL